MTATLTSPTSPLVPVKRPSVSIIVPAFNESGNLRGGVADIHTAAVGILDEYDIIIVDDGSTDETIDVANAIAAEDRRVHVAFHIENRGLRDAYETGLLGVRNEVVVWLPSDREMAQESIADIFRAIGTADLVLPYHGTPQNRSWFRRLLTWGSTTQLNLLLGHRLNYYQGTVVYPTEMARRLPRTESGFFFNAEMLAWALEEGCSYVEVPLVHQERQHGVSKAVSLRTIWRAQMLILRLAFRVHAERMALTAQGMLIG